MHARSSARAQLANATARGRACVLVLVAIFGVLFVTLGAAFPGAGIAGAQSGGNSDNGSGRETNSLTIVKLEGDPASDRMGAGAPESQPLGGITFQINRLEGLDINDQTKLNALAQADPRTLTDQSGYQLGNERTETTGADGKATFSDLPQGVYLVREKPSRVGNKRYSVATPFLVALPDVTGKRNVVVRPKNQPIMAMKNILGGLPGTPEAERIAEEQKRGEVRFRLETTMPAPDVRGKLYQLIVADPLDKNLDFKGVTNGLIANSEKTVELREGEDYRVEVQDAPHGGDYDYADKTVKITLTDKGLKTAAEMRAGHPEARAVFDMHAVVKPGTPAGTKIRNTALSFPDGHDYWLVLGAEPPEWKVESNEVVFTVLPAQAVPSDPEEQLPIQPGEWPDWIFVPIFPLPPGAGNHPLPGHRPQCPPNGVCGSGKPGATAPGHSTGKPGGKEEPRTGLPGLLDRLPMTGASVIGVLVVGVALLLVGFFVVARRRRQQEDNDAHTHRDPGSQLEDRGDRE